MKKAKVILGIVGAVATGALLGILLAPQKGKRTRTKIRSKSSDYAEELINKLESALGTLTNKQKAISEKKETIKTKGKSLLDAAKSDGKSLLKDAETKGKSILDKVESDGKSLLKDAETKGKSIIDIVESDGKSLLKDAETKGKSILDEAESDGKSILDEAKKEIKNSKN